MISTQLVFDDEENLLKAVKKCRDKGIKMIDAYTPFPVHGLDKEMGIKETRLAICSFIYGCIGLGLSLLMMWYMIVSDWPMNIGGKPNFSLIDNLPSFIPIAFESTVLLAAHGVSITFLIRSQVLPGKKPHNPIKRSTDDLFVLLVNDKKEKLEEALNDCNILEFKSNN